ncbi:MAG: EamA family transporter RarD [Planctomycetes bacterium]|nr:EamA family transporter RarD [Planctomycetota bacterium]
MHSAGATARPPAGPSVSAAVAAPAGGGARARPRVEGEAISVPPAHGQVRIGVAAAVFAFVAWGLLPVYWKAIAVIPPAEILAHRILWTTLFAAAALGATRRFGEVAAACRSRRAVAAFVGAGLLLGANWFTFITAVNSDRVFECSLGYYINPLVNVVLGGLFLKERFRPWQLAAIVLAAAGVAYLTAGGGRFPFIALVLALTFAFYSLVRKTACYEALPGLFLEAAVLLAPALTYLAWLGAAPWAAPERASASVPALLAGTGVVTAIPLLTFAFGARRIRLTTVGFIQYLTPTGMFLLGVFAYKEEFAARHRVAIVMIWIALALYSLDAVRAARAGAGGGERREA